MMRISLLCVLLCVALCKAGFFCRDETVVFDEPTAIYSKEYIDVQNCTLVNASLWCEGCDADWVGNTFLSAPCPVFVVYTRHIGEWTDNDVGCSGKATNLHNADSSSGVNIGLFEWANRVRGARTILVEHTAEHAARHTRNASALRVQ